jgi:hypothetical protein
VKFTRIAFCLAWARHLRRDRTLVRGTGALLAMNQPEGFDCPGCAWPEPTAAHRSRFEFCENGAKAMAEETTTVRAAPELFAELIRRGWNDEDLRKLAGQNVIRVLREAEAAAARLRASRPAPPASGQRQSG